MNYSSHPKMKYLYIGIDCHKYIHTASVINCFNEEISLITFNNDKNGFESLVKKVEKLKDNLTLVFGLEDVSHLGYNLCQYLLSKNYIVKHVNSNLSAAERKKRPIISKNDEIDSNCIAKVLLDELDNLQNAQNDEIYWTLKQVITMRDSIISSNIGLKNKLHVQLLYHYPNYNRVFKDISTPTALIYFNTYPSPNMIIDKTKEEIQKFFLENTGTHYSKRTTELLVKLLSEYDIKEMEYQEQRNNIIRILIKQIQQNYQRIKEIDEDITNIYNKLGKKLHTIPCVSIITAASLLAEIGNINRFSNSSKLARYAGIAPIEVSSGGKERALKNEFGNRKLNSIFYSIACVGLSTGITANTNLRAYNPIFKEYYYKKIKDGKTKHQALICIMRRLVNIVYKILKEDIEYQSPEELVEKCNVSFRERVKEEKEKLLKKKELREKHKKK